MTLADFARQIGVDPATARQWKRRGRIAQHDGVFELSQAGRDSLPNVTERNAYAKQPRGATVTERDGYAVMVSSVTEPDLERDSNVIPDTSSLRDVTDDALRIFEPVTPETVTVESCAACAILADEVRALRTIVLSHGLELGEHYNQIQALMAQIETVARISGSGQRPNARAIDTPGPTWGA